MSRSSEHIDNPLNGFVGAVVGGFEATVWGVVSQAAVGVRAHCVPGVQPCTLAHEQQSDLDTFRGETVSVTGTVTLDQSMPLERSEERRVGKECICSIGAVE